MCTGRRSMPARSSMRRAESTSHIRGLKCTRSENIFKFSLFLELILGFLPGLHGTPVCPPSEIQMSRSKLQVPLFLKVLRSSKSSSPAGLKTCGVSRNGEGYARYQRFQRFFILCKKRRLCHAVNLLKFCLFWPPVPQVTLF